LRKTLFWIVALVIMFASAIFQRTTGPTYPKGGSVEIAGQTISYELLTTHAGEGGQPVVVPDPGEGVSGHIELKRHGLDEPWSILDMVAEESLEIDLGHASVPEGPVLIGYLPHQPIAGKLDYRVILESATERVALPETGAIVTRFRGDVPGYFLLPHIFLMFIGLLLSTRAGLEALVPGSDTRKLAIWAFGLLTAGGMILGPIVQYFGFGDLWTGVPLGWDLTDNKTLIFVLLWGWALFAGRGGRDARKAILVAAVVTLAVYLIPHSVLGSEFDYSAQT
jgi:hypothetical protein